MSSILEAIVSKLVALLIGYLWKHHEDKMQAAQQVRQQAQIDHAQEAPVHANQQAEEALARGAVVAGDVASAGSLLAGSEALNAELKRED